MANSDYTIQGTGQFAAVATLVEAIGRNATTVYYKAFTGNSRDLPAAGDAVLIGSEIMRIDEFKAGSMTVARGCMDTIPKDHVAGLDIWFLKLNIGTNHVAYASGEEVGVKALPRTTSKPAMDIAKAPARGLEFTGRFARPYPPGAVLVNGDAWWAGPFAIDSDNSIEITWAHRDRKVQADQLVAHGEASVGPEAGVTYTVRLYRGANETPVATYDAISATTFSYDIDQATADFGLVPGDILDDAKATLCATRDGLDSMEVYEIELGVVLEQPYGLGFRLGESLGGVTP